MAFWFKKRQDTIEDDANIVTDESSEVNQDLQVPSHHVDTEDTSIPEAKEDVLSTEDLSSWPLEDRANLMIERLQHHVDVVEHDTLMLHDGIIDVYVRTPLKTMQIEFDHTVGAILVRNEQEEQRMFKFDPVTVHNERQYDNFMKSIVA
jgi:hypothetical protein